MNLDCRRVDMLREWTYRLCTDESPGRLRVAAVAFADSLALEHGWPHVQLLKWSRWALIVDSYSSDADKRRMSEIVNDIEAAVGSARTVPVAASGDSAAHV